MKRVTVILGLLAVLFSGCSRSQIVWETVDDTVPETAWNRQEPYAMTLGIPDGAEKQMESENLLLYGTADGSYEIVVETFRAADFANAVRTLSGFAPDNLTLILTERFGVPEYHFSWYALTEEGGRLYQTDLLMEGNQCYAVTCSSWETAGNQYDGATRSVFSSLGLHLEEEV